MQIYNIYRITNNSRTIELNQSSIEFKFRQRAIKVKQERTLNGFCGAANIRIFKVPRGRSELCGDFHMSPSH